MLLSIITNEGVKVNGRTKKILVHPCSTHPTAAELLAVFAGRTAFLLQEGGVKAGNGGEAASGRDFCNGEVGGDEHAFHMVHPFPQDTFMKRASEGLTAQCVGIVGVQPYSLPDVFCLDGAIEVGGNKIGNPCQFVAFLRCSS